MTLARKALIVMLFTILASSMVLAQEKIWDRDDEVRERHGSIDMSMGKLHSPNHEYGSFQVHSFNRKNSVSATFRGLCNPLIAFQVIIHSHKLDLSRFLESRSGNDLPISDVLNVIQETISSECDDQIEVIRFSLKNMTNVKENYDYKGTMTKANEWKIEDGRVETAFDDTHTFEIALRDLSSVAGLRYKGQCSANPILLLEPQFRNNSERQLSKPAEIYHWGYIAQNASKKYAEECPDTELIKHIIYPLPKTHKCKVDGEDCFMLTRKSNNWEVDTAELELTDLNSPIVDFPDMLEVLAAGRFDIAQDYTEFFAFYLESFYGIYSDHCASSINDPVRRDIYLIERRFHSSGTLVSEDAYGEPRNIFIERTHANTYDRYFNTWQMWAVFRILEATAKSPNRASDPMLPAKIIKRFFLDNYNELEDIIRGNCTDSRLQTAYKNMFNFANNKPSITGKFTTNKEPSVKYDKDRSSAPLALKVIKEKDQKKAEEQKRIKQASDKKRITDHKTESDAQQNIQLEQRKKTKIFQRLSEEIDLHFNNETQRYMLITKKINDTYSEKKEEIGEKKRSRQETRKESTAVTKSYSEALENNSLERIERLEHLKKAKQAIKRATEILRQIRATKSDEERNNLQQTALLQQQLAAAELEHYKQKYSSKEAVLVPQIKTDEVSTVSPPVNEMRNSEIHANPYTRESVRARSGSVAATKPKPEEIEEAKQQKTEIRRMRQEMTYSLSQENKRYKKLMGGKVAEYNKLKRAAKSGEGSEEVLAALAKAHENEIRPIITEWDLRTQPLKNAEPPIDRAWKTIHELSKPGKTRETRASLRKTVVQQQQLAADALLEYRQLVADQ